MAFVGGHSKGPKTPKPMNSGAASAGMNFGKSAASSAKPVRTSRPISNGSNFSRPNVNGPGFGVGSAFGSAPSRPMNSNAGGGLLGVLATTAAGVAGAAIVNKMQENSQMKLQEQQAESQMRIAEMQAERAAMRAEQNEEYQLEMQRLKNEQEEIKLESLQPTKRYHANCPYCMGVNPNGSKVCEYCGSSLAYYDEADNK